MEDLYGKCGCNCGKCAAYIGNLKSEEDKQKCSDGWKKFLNIKLDTDKCVCQGCQSKDPWKSGGMLPNRSCIIRGCAERSGAKTCANCFNFPCDFLKETSSKYDYTRAWVERRVGEKLSEEDYETFVKCFETFKNVCNIRKELTSEDILRKQPVEPLKIKIEKFPEEINLLNKDKDCLKATYDFLVKVRKCECETYIQQVLNEKRLKPIMMTLWVFGRYGQVIGNDASKLVILSEDVGDKDEFKNIIRKKDNYLHGSAQQVAFILKQYGINMEHVALPHKQWKLTLSVDDNHKESVLRGIKMFCEKLVELYGEPQPLSAWKLEGEAFKKFEKVDFNDIN